MPIIGIVLGYGLVFLLAKCLLWEALDPYTRLHLALGAVCGLWIIGEGLHSLHARGREEFSDFGIAWRKGLLGLLAGVALLSLFVCLCWVTIQGWHGPWWLVIIHGVGLLLIAPYAAIFAIDRGCRRSAVVP
jgi:hypothetical protein